MLFILDIMQVTFVRPYCGFANNRFQLLGYELSNKNEQCTLRKEIKDSLTK